MKIAIISDIHENFHNLFLALDEIEKQNCDQIICLGDMMNTGITKILNQQKIPVFGIWGNNDGDYTQIFTHLLKNKGSLTMGKGSYDFLTLDNLKIFLTHYEDLHESLAKSQDFDLILYGHTHIKDLKTIEKTTIINPGELSAHRTKTATFAIFDTKDKSVNFVELKNSITGRTNYVEEKLKKYFNNY